MFIYSIYACFIGFFIDFIIGDPQWLFHPIRLIGKLIVFFEKYFRKIFSNTKKGLKIAGLLLVILVCSISSGIVFIIVFFTYKLNFYCGLIFESIICYFMIAAKALKTESINVYNKILYADINESRKAVSMIVGRDVNVLDEKGVIKAAVETVAENLSDGVIAPIIYMIIGGSTLGIFYKAINTMDSMIGYKNDRYIYFGKSAAKLDDFMNFFPSRISAFIMILASFILKKDYKNAVRIFKRDRFKHSSPNSGQTEAVCAGALDIQLAGDAYYFGKLYKKPLIGDAIKDVNPKNILEINSIMYLSSVIALFLFGIFGVFINVIFGGVLF